MCRRPYAVIIAKTRKVVASSLQLQLAAGSKELLNAICRLISAAHKYLCADVQRKGWLVVFFLQYMNQQLLENIMGTLLLISVSILQ